MRIQTLMDAIEVAQRLAVPVLCVTFFPACIALGYVVRSWNPKLTPFSNLQLAFWNAVHDQAERFWHWCYYKRVRPLRAKLHPEPPSPLYTPVPLPMLSSAEVRVFLTPLPVRMQSNLQTDLPLDLPQTDPTRWN